MTVFAVRERKLEIMPDDTSEALVLQCDHAIDATINYSAAQRIDIVFGGLGEGRGYTLAKRLRERHHVTGPIRATGTIIPDQIGYLVRCGFDQFVFAQARHISHVQRLEDFSHVNQPQNLGFYPR